MYISYLVITLLVVVANGYAASLNTIGADSVRAVSERRKEASVVLRGAQAVAAHTSTYASLSPFVRTSLVNGAAGAVVVTGGCLFSVWPSRWRAGGFSVSLAALDLTLPVA
jgi:hypothetical protein